MLGRIVRFCFRLEILVNFAGTAPHCMRDLKATCLITVRDALRESLRVEGT